MYPHNLRVRVKAGHPYAFAICDRCAFLWNHRDLQWQFDWRGNALQNLRILVCPDCYDTPQPNGRRPVIIGPDPVPVKDPRPGFYASQMEGSVPGPSPGPGPAVNAFVLDSPAFGVLDLDVLG